MLFRMAMKMASLRCGVVIALSFLAARAGAQDSLNLRLRLVSDTLNVSGPTIVTPHHGSQYAGNGFSAKLPLNLDLMLSVSETTSTNYDTIRYGFYPDPMYLTIQFFVDSSKGLLRDMLIKYDTIEWIDGSQVGESYTYDWEYTLLFDSISFFNTGRALVLPDTVYHGWARWECVYHHDVDLSSEAGVGSVSEWVEDSLYLVLSTSTSAVANALPIVSLPLNIAWNSWLNSIRASFSPSDSPRMLEITDLVGRTATSIPVSSGNESIELPSALLSPGCYFARLGDQVAKFVVPPR